MFSLWVATLVRLASRWRVRRVVAFSRCAVGEGVWELAWRR